MVEYLITVIEDSARRRAFFKRNVESGHVSDHGELEKYSACHASAVHALKLIQAELLQKNENCIMETKFEPHIYDSSRASSALTFSPCRLARLVEQKASFGELCADFKRRFNPRSNPTA